MQKARREIYGPLLYLEDRDSIQSPITPKLTLIQGAAYERSNSSLLAWYPSVAATRSGRLITFHKK